MQNLLRGELLNKKAIKAIVPNLKKAARKMAEESKTDSEALRSRLAELNDQAVNLISAIKMVGASSYIQAELVQLEEEKQKINRALVDADLRIVVYSSDDEELSEILYQDMDDLNSDDDERVERVIRKYIQRVEVNFAPDDPPRKGHKRKYEVSVDGQIPRGMVKSRM